MSNVWVIIIGEYLKKKKSVDNKAWETQFPNVFPWGTEENIECQGWI